MERELRNSQKERKNGDENRRVKVKKKQLPIGQEIKKRMIAEERWPG